MDILPNSPHEDSWHILNGDALKNQMAETTVTGSVIVVREVMMDGPLDGDFPEEFYQNRGVYLAGDLEDFEVRDYFEWTVTELEKIKSISDSAVICLWFEDDLFCQANMWFVLHLLFNRGLVNQLYWVRPLATSRYSFGHLRPEDLNRCYADRVQISAEELALLDQLWRAYAVGDVPKMREVGDQLASGLPVIQEAVRLHVDRLPNGEDPGRPVRVLRAVVEEVGRADFGKVLGLFQERLPEYGYGDLQVRRMLKELK
jgi:hypothetical protein